MSNISDYIASVDDDLELHFEGNWNERASFNADGKFMSFNDAGLECEVGELLYGFVRTLKPANVLETGTHVGVGATYIGMALRENGFGTLDTVEFLPEIYEKAKNRISHLNLTDQVNVFLEDATKFTPTHKYQMILLDTEPQTRFQELVRYFNYLDEGGFVFIHDLHRHMHQIPNEEHGFAWPFGEIDTWIKRWVEEGYLRPFHFPTPRGLTGFYKVHQEDYKWPKTDVNTNN